MLSPELTLLMQGRAILSDPKKWTKGVAARDACGERIHSGHSEATCWCSIGILRLLDQGEIRDKALELFHKQVEDLAVFNDGHSHEEVLSLWDRVIAAQYAEETGPVPQPDPESLHAPNPAPQNA